MRIKSNHLKKIIELNSTIPKKELVFLSLLEEIGELACELSIDLGYKKRKPSVDGILGEAVDVVICLLSYAYHTYQGETTDEEYDLESELYGFPTPIEDLNRFVHCVSTMSHKNWLLSCLEFPLYVFVKNGGSEELLDQLLTSKIEKWEKNTNA